MTQFKNARAIFHGETPLAEHNTRDPHVLPPHQQAPDRSSKRSGDFNSAIQFRLTCVVDLSPQFVGTYVPEQDRRSGLPKVGSD